MCNETVLSQLSSFLGTRGTAVCELSSSTAARICARISSQFARSSPRKGRDRSTKSLKTDSMLALAPRWILAPPTHNGHGGTRRVRRARLARSTHNGGRRSNLTRTYCRLLGWGGGFNLLVLRPLLFPSSLVSIARGSTRRVGTGAPRA